MKRHKIIWRVLKRTGATKLLTGYLITLAVISVAIVFVEPNINTLQDGVWYCFSVLTTIGFGDLLAVTVVGRILSIILSIYSILIIAIIPGIVTSFYLEIVKVRSKESVENFLYDLERLPELSKEELVEISERVKKINKR